MTTPSLERSLRPGGYLAYRGEIYQITTVHPDRLEVTVVNQATQEEANLNLATLLTTQPETLRFAPSLAALHEEMQQAAPPSGLFDAHTLPAPLLTRARHILVTVETVEAQVAQVHRQSQLQDRPFQRTPVLKQVLARLDPPLALSTFYKYRLRYNETGGSESALAAALRRSSLHQTRMSSAQLHFLDTLILRYYNRKSPLRPQTLYRLAQSVLKRTGGHWLNPARSPASLPAVLVDELLDPTLPAASVLANPEKALFLTPIQLPSRSWFYTYLRWFEQQPEQGKAVVTTRSGAQQWEREYLVFDSFVNRAALPLEYIFADHYLLDVFIVDETTRQQRDRLWLTLLIDAYSRSILGMALLYEPPSIMSIQTALQHALWPKTSHHAFGLVEDWACYGIPQQLSLDNAWAHHSHSLEDLARLVSQNGRYASIDLVFRPPYRGRYGALVERFFGNLAGQIRSLLPGALHSSQPQHVRQAVRDACLLYQDVNRFVHQTILHYQHTVHSELQGMTPHEKWLEGMQMGLPLVPPQTPEMLRAFWRLHPQTRVVSSKGICAFGMAYGSPELSQAARYDRQGKRVPYAFRYDPANIGCLALFRDGRWVGDVYAHPLRQPDGSWLTLSLAEREMAQRMAREAGDSSRDWLHYLHDLLNYRLAQLDPDKSVDIQRGEQIVRLQQRLRLKLVRYPLEIDIQAVQQAGYEAVRQQLAAQFALLTRDQRRLWLHNFLFIMTPDLRRLNDKMAQVRAYRSFGQQRNFLLGGPSGMGKSTYLDWFAFHHLPQVQSAVTHVPVIKIDAPVSNKSPKPLFQRLILECGMTYSRHDNEEELLMKLVLFLHRCGTELLIVDEIEHITRPFIRRRFLEISNLTRGIPMVCASCHPLRWTEGDAEVAGRWNDYFELQQYTGNRLQQLLAFVELLLPFSQPSSLALYQIPAGKHGQTVAGPAVLIERWTGGILRDIMMLVMDASTRTIQRELSALSPGLLEESWHAIQTRQVTDFLQILEQQRAGR